MNTFSLSNIPLNKFRTFLFNQGCSRVSTEGGHEKWTREGLTRPIIIQTHIDPVSELIVRPYDKGTWNLSQGIYLRNEANIITRI